jgi:excisionase family DNA binding protein
MSYTLAEAAVACGLDKSTIRRAVRSGRISGTRDEAGTWRVEPVELHRLYPPAARPVDNPTAAPRDAAPDALVAELRAQLADMRSQRDAWQRMAEARVLALPAPRRPWPWWWWKRAG